MLSQRERNSGSFAALSPRPSRQAHRPRPQGTSFTMTQPAPAKLNLFLEVRGKRADGFHELETCMVALDLHDSLSFAPAGDLLLSCDDPSLTTGPDNLVMKAARLLQRHTGCQRGAAIHLTKRIPMAAGLGGGSSDAAATLRGLCQLWELPLALADLQELAAELGSDVPFFLHGPAAWCTGRGETIEPFPLTTDLAFVLLCPNLGVGTAEVYRRLQVPGQSRDSRAMRQALAAGNVQAIGRELFNRLEEAAWPLCPPLEPIRQLIRELSASQPILGHQMSGSGSTYFVLCPSVADAQRVAAALRSAGERLRGQDDPGLALLVVRSQRPGG